MLPLLAEELAELLPRILHEFSSDSITALSSETAVQKENAAASQQVAATSSVSKN